MLRISQSRLAVAGRPRPSLKLELFGPTLDPAITFTRALNTATYFDSAGVLTTANANVARFDYDPATLAPRGLLIEEARTNSIRNNTMQGAVAGSPGTLPQVSGSASWSAAGPGPNIIGIGIENGVTYIDIQFVGTTGATSGNVAFETVTAIAAASGQTWTNSVYIRLVAGSFTNVSQVRVNMQGYTSASAANTDAFNSADIISSLSATNISTNRKTITGTLADATTAYIRPRLFINWTNGAAVDFTLRIGLPQLEQGAFPTSVIPTTTTALTRNADVASVNTLTPWYNAVEGTLFVQAQDMSDSAHATSQPRAISLNDGTTSNTMDISRVPASAQGRARIDVGGVNQFNSLNTAWPLATQAKVALAYKANDYAACLGGGTVFTNTASSSIPTVTKLVIGNIAAANSWVGWIQRATYYPRRLSNAELQAITA